jgi:hypothetical protein
MNKYIRSLGIDPDTIDDEGENDDGAQLQAALHRSMETITASTLQIPYNG